MHFSEISAGALSTPANTGSMSCQCTTSIVLAISLPLLLALLFAVFTIAMIIAFIRSKKQAKREADVYYDTINIGHHSKPTTVIETEVNVAYGRTKPT